MCDHPPTLRAASNCCVQIAGLYWRSPESGGFWYKSINCFPSEGGWIGLCIPPHVAQRNDYRCSITSWTLGPFGVGFALHRRRPRPSVEKIRLHATRADRKICTHRPKILRQEYSQEHGTLLGTVCALLFFASNPSRRCIPQVARGQIRPPASPKSLRMRERSLLTTYWSEST